MDLWALGCLIYELYSRKPVIGHQTSEEEALEKLASNSLELSDLDSIPAEATQAIQALLQLRGEERQSAAHILELPLLARCPSHLSLLATLPQPLPPRFQSGDLDHKSAGATVALRRQVVATSEIQVPRLIIVLPSSKACRTWTNPETWDGDTFNVHFLCEGAPGMHFTDAKALTLSDPKIFFSQAGLLVAVTSQLCSLYMSPEFLGDLDTFAANSLMSYGAAPDAYFNDLAKVLEKYCSAYGSEPAIRDAARALQLSRPQSNEQPSLDAWITQWTSLARDALTSTRHIALQEVRLLIQGGYESPDPGLIDFTGLVYSRQLPPLSPGAPSIPQPRWHAWLCSAHAQQPSLPQA
ncbi:hypothetical protein DSO57_1027146 [Entomophthora muscae]|uniref:Uncharacterized protein n=1 Tax=Entomophthora muscae TaxID=34485 RepID=A0ACC2S3S6_9FUNG|nr:hypothetical protein DSO57_1027146 [Entomophthora muscae]